MFSIMLTVDKIITESQCICNRKSCITVDNISVNSGILLIYVPSLLKDFVQIYKMERGAVMCERHVSKGRVSLGPR